MTEPPGIFRFKICGIARLEDALEAIRLGADGVGFLVRLNYPSEDQLDPGVAATIVAQLPPLVSSVLVTHSTDLQEVVGLCREVKNNTIQLHGDFALDEIPALRERLPALRVIKAVHVGDPESSLQKAAEAAARGVDAVLLDTLTGTRIGGTGKTHDWSISRTIRDQLQVPTILAGGLTPQNVGEAISTVRPFGVDVNSGVSVRRGIKSPELLARFIAAARASLEA